ncbi:MAG: anti-sigma factor family protein [Armatimonadota bacterium]
MKCGRIERLIQKYVDGTLSPSERALVEQHVSECSGCDRALADARQLVSLLRGLPQRTLSDSFDERLMAAIRETTPAPAPVAWWQRFRLQFDWRLRAPAMMTAAAVAAGVLGAFLLPHLGEERAPAPSERQFLASAMERHLQIENARPPVEWDATDVSIDLNTGIDLVSYQAGAN